MKKEWKDLSEGMPRNVPCEVMQKGGSISIAAFRSDKTQSGICKLEEREPGKFWYTNTFLLKVVKFRIL